MTMMMGNDGYKFMSIGLQLWPGFRRIWTGSSCYAMPTQAVGVWELVRENPGLGQRQQQKMSNFPGFQETFGPMFSSWQRGYATTVHLLSFSRKHVHQGDVKPHFLFSAIAMDFLQFPLCTSQALPRQRWRIYHRDHPAPLCGQRPDQPIPSAAVCHGHFALSNVDSPRRSKKFSASLLHLELKQKV